jgi:hypothetical protein
MLSALNICVDRIKCARRFVISIDMQRSVYVAMRRRMYACMYDDNVILMMMMISYDDDDDDDDDDDVLMLVCSWLSELGAGHCIDRMKLL